MTIGQSMTIARYLARRFGLAGKTDVDAAEADQAVDAINDLLNNLGPVRTEQDEEKKAEMKKKLQTETFPNWLKMMETLLTSKGGKYFAGKQLTWADIAVYHSLEMLQVSHSLSDDILIFVIQGVLGEPDMEGCPNLLKMLETVKNLPNIQKWVAARPNTPMQIICDCYT